MSTIDGLRQVWRQRGFRRLLGIKVLFQSADGMVQVGVASYTLLSPERQPNAWAIAGVLAVTMLPFSIVGPFVSVVIDRWDRRRTLIRVDTARFLICLFLAALVWLAASRSVTGVILVAALVVMSLERFQAAVLLASLPRTVDAEEYLAANTAVPLIGPFGLMVGALVAAAVRLSVGRWTSHTTADALIFLLAGVLFLLSAAQSRGFARGSLGPQLAPGSAGPRLKLGHAVGLALRDLKVAWKHLAGRSPAALGVTTLTAMRLVFGFVMVAIVLIYRNHFHGLAEVDAAVADLALWVAATGAGSIVASAVNPVLARRLTLRWTVVVTLLAAAVCQVVPGSIFTRPTLVVASFFLGLWTQCVRINVDTLIQAHIDNDTKGRVLVLYDLAFNVPLVIAGLLAALILPVDGLSRPAFLACGGILALLAGLFAWGSHVVGPAQFDRGTESVTGRWAEPAA